MQTVTVIIVIKYGFIKKKNAVKIKFYSLNIS